MLVREQLLSVGKFSGSYPTIPLPDGMAEGFGEDAMFVTLPIGRVDARSRNGRVYTREAVQAIVDAVNTNKPEGRWGHLRDEERPYAYDPPAIRWLAAMIDDNGTAWAKGIPVTDEAREHFRVAKLAGSRVGTSVYGFGQMEGERVVDFELETIDLAAPDRVGIPDTAAKPMITSEQENYEGDGMSEITLADVPDSVRRQIIEQAQAENAGERLSEMQETVTQLQNEKTTLQEQVETLEQERDAARGEASALLANYARSKIAEQVQIKPVRKLVERTVGIQEMDDGLRIEGAATMEQVDEAIEAALADEDMQALNKEAFAEMFGPKHTPPAHNRNKDNDGGGSGLTMIPG